MVTFDFSEMFRKSHEFRDDDVYNDLFIRCQERYLNDLLKVKGFLSFKEILCALGFPERMALTASTFTKPFQIKYTDEIVQIRYEIE